MTHNLVPETDMTLCGRRWQRWQNRADNIPHLSNTARLLSPSNEWSMKAKVGNQLQVPRKKYTTPVLRYQVLNKIILAVIKNIHAKSNKSFDFLFKSIQYK